MVSRISTNPQFPTNFQIGDSPVAVADNTSIAKVDQRQLDSLEKAGKSANTFNNVGLEMPAGIKVPSSSAGVVTEYDLSVVTGGPSDVDNITGELKIAFKDNPKALAALDNLLSDKNFIKLNDEAQLAVLSQCKNFPNANSVSKLQKMCGASWFKKQSLEDMQRSSKSIAYMAETAQANPGSLQETILENTMGRLFSGEIPLYFVEIQDDPGKVTYGYAYNNRKGIYINKDFVPAGNDDLCRFDNRIDETILATIPHETSHQVNNDVNKANYKYFQAEYRAWYVGYVARYGEPPCRIQAFQRSREIINIYDSINDAFYGNWWEDFLDKLNKFFTGDPLESEKIANFLKQMVEEGTVVGDDKQSKVDFLLSRVTDPIGPAPLPADFNHDMDN